MNRYRRPFGQEMAEDFATERRLYGVLAQFSPEAPPEEWERQHDAEYVNTYDRPVPRLASHHYFALDGDARNVYFY